MKIDRRIAIGALASAALAWTTILAEISNAAEPYPSKPVRLIVPYPPGGPTDGLARILSAELSKKWDQQVYIDNRPGAAGILGAEATAKAAPDGYTLFFAANTQAINVSLFKKLPYDTVKDFTPISLVATYPLILVVPTASPIKSLRDLVAMAKEKPGSLNYATASLGTPTHLAMEMLNWDAGIDVTRISYQGAQAATLDLIAGRVDMMFDNPVSALPLIKDGKLRALAVSSRVRSKMVPDVPTVDELGYPEFEATTWDGIFAPAGLPTPLLAKLEKDIMEVTQSPEITKTFASLMTEPVGTTSQQFSAILKSDIEKWGKIIRAAKIQIQ